MATLFKGRLTKKDSTEDIVATIVKLGADKNARVLLDEHCDWLEAKLKEVARLGRILKRRLKD